MNKIELKNSFEEIQSNKSNPMNEGMEWNGIESNQPNPTIGE